MHFRVLAQFTMKLKVDFPARLRFKNVQYWRLYESKQIKLRPNEKN
jgi:hypothetical protein